MDEKNRTRVVCEVLEELTRNDDEREQIRGDIERALQLLPKVLGVRVRDDERVDPSAGPPAKSQETILFELVTEARLFTARVTRESSEPPMVSVQLRGRQFDDGVVDAEMTQHGHKRTWTFWPGAPPKQRSSVDGQTLDDGPDEDELFARALASRLGWGSPDVT
jgi:hypothetical protein